METRKITLASDDLTLAGDLYLPPGAREQPAPAIVFTGPFTGVKEQVTGNYARRLAEAGFVALAFDHRNFGESAGTPRQHEDAAGKLADLRDAVSYLAGLPEVDARRIGACGVCLGAGYALRFAAFDPRVKALALIAGCYNDPREMRRRIGPAGYRELLAHFAAVAERQLRSGEVEYLPAVGNDGSPAAMGGPEPFAYYGTARAARPGWVNRVTDLSRRELITLDCAFAADFIAPTPVLVVHGRADGYCPRRTPRGCTSGRGSQRICSGCRRAITSTCTTTRSSSCPLRPALPRGSMSTCAGRPRDGGPASRVGDLGDAQDGMKGIRTGDEEENAPW
jgi:fermentation-respiration switch protein FrsA (DUF1100 family)